MKSKKAVQSELKTNPELSVVTPVYGSPNSLSELAKRVRAVCEELGVSYELIMVDDRCPHGSWQRVRTIAEEDEAVRAIRLSRNFGQHAAIYAGLNNSRGDWVVVMDCDIQDVPEEIANLYKKAQEGYHIVLASRSNRSDNKIRRFVSWLFYNMLSYLTGVKHSEQIANFGIYSRKVVDSLTSWNESLRYFPADVSWIGFKTAKISVAHNSRHSGSSSYTIGRLSHLALSIIISFSDKPLRIIAMLGFLVSVFSFFVVGYLVFTALVFGIKVPGWTSVLASMWLLSGFLIFTVGLTGLYVGQVMRDSKKRPLYIIDETIR